jgi:ribulose-phosphate 3-epimerase
MDGHFVPNLTFGMPVIAALRKTSALFFDCHLMTTNPHVYFKELREAGADLVTVHIEIYPNPTEVAASAREHGLAFGLALNPPTPFEAVEPYLDLLDLLLVMSVHPGFGGQTFIPDVLAKVEQARRVIDLEGLGADIQVDGGITTANALQVRAAGADILVAGSAIFGTADPALAVRELRAAAGSME